MIPCALAPKFTSSPKRGYEFIYGLLCPDSGTVRYVGRTCQSLQSRLNLHHAQLKAPKQPNEGLMTWKKELVAQGKRPVIKLLQVVHREAAAAAERKWTRHYQKPGLLLNIRNVLLADSSHGHDLWRLNDIADNHRQCTLSLTVATGVGMPIIVRFLSGAGRVSKAAADQIASYLNSLPAQYMPRFANNESAYTPYYNFS